MIKKYFGLTLMATLVATSVLAYQDDNGFLLDNDYYESPSVNSQPQPMPRTTSRNWQTGILSPNGKPTIVEMLNKGGYVARLSASYDVNGQRIRKTTRNAYAGQRVGIELPANAANVTVGADLDDGFFGRGIFGASLNSRIVVRTEGPENLLTYHVWGTTFWPRWRLMFQ